MSKTISIPNQAGGGGTTEIKLQVWDTAGQEKYRSIAPIYYRDAHAAIIVFDITSEATFNNIEQAWISSIKLNAKPDIVLGLCGNKCDLY
mmetsp:Transcript_38871/g.28752  ORF Transcript_38871/g.28752 Transcript_38871/m.28752 type:complete len:90 (+) Transcript_38871:138-407(+)